MHAKMTFEYSPVKTNFRKVNEDKSEIVYTNPMKFVFRA